MSYQVIARKWRPQTFDQLVGQNHISQTLANALKNGRLPHALLFTGPRGTGKTSSARILAKSLRCPNAVDFAPCNECTSCQEISLSRSVDVIEIDGASNNGVDAIRELRDTVGYMPSSGKYKIYIIDEVHMLSTSAFNALLKTLEEPPEHVVFIMATTEVHKIPQTILSRCQRFDFRSISTRQITDRLKLICDSDGVKAEEEALWIIARQGDGSMRDSQSLLDQVITFANGPLTRESVVQILGLTDRTLLLETLSALAGRDSSAVMDIISKIFQAGYDPSLFAQDVLESIRHLLLIKMSGDNSSQIIELPESEIRFLKSLGQDLSVEDIHMLFDMMLKGASDIAKSSDPRIVLEMVLLRVSVAPQVVSIESLLSGNSPQPSAKAKPSPQIPQKPQAPSKKADPMKLNPHEKWFEFVKDLKSKDALLAAKVEPLNFVSDTEQTLTLTVPAKVLFLKDQLTEASTFEKLSAAVQKYFGPTYKLNLGSGKEDKGVSAQAIAQEKAKKTEQEIAEQIADHPMVKKATSALNGQIKAIKDTSS